ncbi:RimJ/RimL family protein N-acetyltransferase [Arthrobacter sp. UYP6]|uniref:hypothetical protein n=1 Tax=Arthrobacter sp. UYP6 TaxID=1756378 RepID=UPI00339A303F
MLTLETRRLLLRPSTDDDAGFVLDLYSRWEVQRFLGLQPKLMKDSDEALALIAAWRGSPSLPRVRTAGPPATSKLAGIFTRTAGERAMHRRPLQPSWTMRCTADYPVLWP